MSMASTSASRSDHLQVAPALERAVGVEHVRNAAAHACGEIPTRAAEHEDAATGHVLAPVVADALNHHDGSAIAHTKTFAREAAEVRFAARGAIERHVPDDDVLLGP